MKFTKSLAPIITTAKTQSAIKVVVSMHETY